MLRFRFCSKKMHLKSHSDKLNSNGENDVTFRLLLGKINVFFTLTGDKDKN